MKFQFLQHRVALSMHFPVFINGLATLGLATVLRVGQFQNQLLPHQLEMPQISLWIQTFHGFIP